MLLSCKPDDHVIDGKCLSRVLMRSLVEMGAAAAMKRKFIQCNSLTDCRRNGCHIWTAQKP